MSYVMQKIILVLLLAWASGFMLGTLWGFFEGLLHAVFNQKESE